MKTFTEEDLIAYHLGDLSWLKRQQLRRALEKDSVLAAESEAIAETLRAFRGDAAPIVDDAMLERSWQRVRPTLEVLSPVKQHRTRTVWLVGAGSAFAGAMAVVLLLVTFVHRVPGTQEAANGAQSTTITDRAHALIAELQGKKSGQGNNSKQEVAVLLPDAVADDPSLAAHLDTAERVLTEVSHSDGRLEPETREQVHRLLLENATYYQSAETRGDTSTAAVIDDLGRVLTALDAEPTASAHDEDSVRLQIHVGDVLLDLRILGNGSEKKQATTAKPVEPAVYTKEKLF